MSAVQYCILFTPVFFLGAACASFVNVLAGGTGSIRTNLIRKRSRCDACKKTLRWWELVPVLSWLALHGRCPRCTSRIPFFHPASEIILGVAFVSTVLCSSEGLLDARTFGILAVAVIFYFFSVYDIFHGVVINRYVLVAIAAAVLWQCIQAGLHQDVLFLLDTAAGAMGYVVFLGGVNVLSTWGVFPGVPRGQEGFGWGDAKYGLFLGFILGWQKSFLALALAIFAGAFAGMVVLIKERRRGLTLPFVPFMSLGAWVALVWGDEITELIRVWIVYGRWMM